ncbi:MAG: O-antigen ligase [Candidatus Nomurabacteria bacterium]
MKNFREWILKYGSLFVIFITPLLYIDSMFSPYVSPKTFFFYGFVEILTMFWIYSFITDRSYRLSLKQLLYFIPFALYILWLSIAGILAVDPTLAFWSSLGRATGLITIYHAFVLSLIVASLLKKYGSEYLYSFISWLLNSSFIIALSVWFGDEGFNIFFKDSRGGGLIGNSSMTAAYLLFSIALGFFFLFSKKMEKGKKWWIGIVLATIIFSSLFINMYGLLSGKGLLGSARGASLGISVIVGVTVLGCMALSKKKVLRVLGIAGIVISIVAFSIGWMSLMKPRTYLHEKFTQATNGNRFTFWDMAQKGIDEHPYFGYGIENYGITSQEYFNPEILDQKYGYEGWTDHSHNVYFDTGIAGGYPAIVLYFAFLLSIIYGIYRASKNGNISDIQASILTGLIVGYFFQNLFVFDSLLSIIILYVLAGIIFALQDVYTKEKIPKVVMSEDKKKTITFLLSIAVIPFLIFFVVMPIDKAVSYKKLISMNIDDRPSYYESLLGGSSVGSTIDISSIASTIYHYYAVNLPQIKGDKNTAPYVDADLKALTAYLEKVIEGSKSKSDYRLYISTVLLYNTEVTLTERPYDQALADHLYSLLDHASKLSPTNPETYWAKANISAWHGDLKGAEGAYREAIAMDPKAPGSYRLLLRLAKVTNNQKLYDGVMKEANNAIPGFELEVSNVSTDKL